MKTLLTRLLLSVLATLLVSCAANPQALIDRNQRILQEQPGNYYVGRRVAVERTRFWGYVREPRQMWDSAKLVMMNERQKLTPDRLPEAPRDGQKGFQYDNNFEYILRGRYTGNKIYDPNSNKILPEFLLQDYKLSNDTAGFLFHPREKRDYLGCPVPPRR